jgi:quercetin dioxygenase-like cupin family protein
VGDELCRNNLIKEKLMMHGTEPLLPGTIRGWTLGPTIDEMLQSQPAEGGKASRTLVKDKAMTVVLTVLSRGQTLREHKAPAAVMVVPLRGEVVFDCQGNSSTVGGTQGSVLAMGKGQLHAVEALSDSAFLLVIGPVDHSSD